MWSRILVFLLLSSVASAQAPVSKTPAIDNQFVHQQFGETCDVEPQVQAMTADLNGDGIPDLVFVARCKNPLIDQDEKNFRVIDPMDAFYGYGNISITSRTGQEDPRMRGICLMIIHGAGPEAWRSSAPGPKFVVINIAVKSFALRRMKLSRKKFTNAIYIEEATGDEMTSAVFWDGKKYRYSPLGSAME
jgi:hypothetical protein